MAQGSAGLELATMQAVADALSKLEDPAARARVLQWANAYFSSAAATSTTPAAGVDAGKPQATARKSRADPENLYSLFGRAREEQPVVAEIKEAS